MRRDNYKLTLMASNYASWLSMSVSFPACALKPPGHSFQDAWDGRTKQGTNLDNLSITKDSLCELKINFHRALLQQLWFGYHGELK